MKQEEFCTGNERTHSNRESSAERLGENTPKEEDPIIGTWREQIETGRAMHRDM